MKKLFSDVPSIVVFTVAFLLGLFILPTHIRSGEYFYLGIIFVSLFALNMTCVVHTMRARAKVARASGAGVVGVVTTAVGFTALQMCGVGGPLCGALFGSIVFASILPAGSLGLVTHYAVEIVLVAIVIQAVSLWYLGCLKK